VRARGQAHLQAQIARKDGSRLDLDLHGDLVDLLPWRVPPAALHWHASFLPTPAGVVCAAAWRAPHVHVKDGVRFTLRDPGDPKASNTGDGDELWLALGDASSRGLLRGAPALASVAAKDQSALARAETIEFTQADQKLLVTLTPARGRESSVQLAAAGDPEQSGRTKVGVRELTMYCRGQIKIEPRQVRFLGPVRVLGDEAAGKAPTLTVTADGMVMQRDAGGAVTDLVADGHVQLASARLVGAADTLALDLERALLVMGSRHGVATIALDSGPQITSSHLEVDYTTYAVRAWYGDVGPRDMR
jgi:hypothetical protein